jgi:hypothetical protein
MLYETYLYFNQFFLMIGAAFRGAGLSRQFKVKEVKVKDITPYPIEVGYSSEPKESEDGNIQVRLVFDPFWLIYIYIKFVF